MKLSNHKIFVFPSLMLLLFINCKNNADQVNKNNFTNLSPIETISLYWKASYEGNVDVVNQLIIEEPNDFTDDCHSITNEIERKEENKKISSQDFFELIKSIKRNSNTGVFEKYYNKNSEFFSIYSLSHLINIDRYPVQNLVIDRQYTFQDESRIDLTYNDWRFEKGSEFSFFLKKSSNGWKIFLILDKASLNLSENKDYGKNKPKCLNLISEHR